MGLSCGPWGILLLTFLVLVGGWGLAPHSALGQEEPAVSAPITITDDDGGEVGLTLGLDPDATEGNDEMFGEEREPPFPPDPSSLLARFVDEHLNDGNGLSDFPDSGMPVDIRQGSASFSGTKVYEINFATGDGASEVTISWNLPDGVTGTIEDRFGGGVYGPETMEGTGSLTIGPDAPEAILTIEYSGNQPPTIDTNAGLDLTEGRRSSITTSELAASDPDDGPADLTFSVTSGPSEGELLLDGSQTSSFTQSDLEGGSLEYNHTGSGDDSFAFDLEDPSGDGPSGKTFQIDVNAPPAASFSFAPSDPNVGETVTFDASGSEDPDGSVVEYRWDFNNDGQVEETTQSATTTVSFSSAGEKTVGLTVVDDDGATGEASETVAVNAPPTASNDTAQTEAGQPVTTDVLANDTDPDGSLDASTVQVESGPSNGSASANSDGTVTYAPGGGFTGTDSYTYTVADTDGARSGEATVTIEVEPTSPLAPVPEEVSASSLPDRAVEISWKAGGEGGADQHYLYRSRSPIDSSAGPGGLVPHDTLEGSGESEAEAHVDTSVSLGKTYYYRLTAAGEEGEESGFSGEAVGIGYLAGDPSEDGRVNAADASLVLQDAVQKITFDEPQRRAGDVSGEGRANAGDASLILQHAVGLITQFPVEEESGAIAAATDAATDAATSAATAGETSKSASMAPMDRVSGQLAWGQARPADQKEGTEVPVRLEGNAQNVRSVRLEGAFDPSTLEVLGAEPSAEGWQASSQISQGQGWFRVAMAGPESASSGQVAVLRVKVKEEAIEEAREPTLSADGVLNGAARRGLSAKTVRPVPSEIKLGRSAPNPAQGPVTIEYGLPEETRVQIEVYDVLGRKVTTLVEGSRPPGRHEVTLEGGRLPSGTYFYRMKADGRQKTRRLTVVQ
ncbi:PKD repeat protein [Salinibacter ruber]|uniref:Ig-like domain-containing protein n=1 Tax=Salinibacter ruber TaxID=146919 RepID=UPI002168551F|nr:PKD repeat protein [Salinibacter ruber]